MIKVKKLVKYSKAVIVRFEQSMICLFLFQRSILTISGKSGSGKSTLLYQLGLLDEPTHGSIKIDKLEVVGLNEERTYNDTV